MAAVGVVNTPHLILACVKYTVGMHTARGPEALASSRVLLRPIPPPLQPFVDHIWAVDAQYGAPPQPVIADGAVDLIVRLGAAVHPVDSTALAPCMRQGEAKAYVLGPRLLPVFVQLMPATLLVGIRFRPGGAFPFFGTSLAEFTDCAIGLDTLWGRQNLPALAEHTSVNELLQALGLALLARLPRVAAPHPSVVTATTILKASAGQTSIQVVARQAGLSERQLERLFRTQVGLSPKVLARIIRVQRAREALLKTPESALAQIALQAGFADQAHFTREYTALIGIPPGWEQRALGSLAQR